jgi:hypothetical protein
MKSPRSAYDKVGGMVYFGRMVEKIRLQAAGVLAPDYFANLGKGMDLRTCSYLHVDYAALAEQVRAGLDDEQALAWCFQHGRSLNEVELHIYNGFSTKRGLRDEASATLEEHKRQSGLEGRADIQTFFDFFEVDEKRRP